MKLKELFKYKNQYTDQQDIREANQSINHIRIKS